MGEIWLVVTVRWAWSIGSQFSGWLGNMSDGLGGGGRFEQVTKAMSVGRTYFVLQPLRLLLRFERHKAVALADASPVDDDFRGLDVAVRGEHTTQFRLGCVATERTKQNVVKCKCIFNKFLTLFRPRRYDLESMFRTWAPTAAPPAVRQHSESSYCSCWRAARMGGTFDCVLLCVCMVVGTVYLCFSCCCSHDLDICTYLGWNAHRPVRRGHFFCFFCMSTMTAAATAPFLDYITASGLRNAVRVYLHLQLNSQSFSINAKWPHTKRINGRQFPDRRSYVATDIRNRTGHNAKKNAHSKRTGWWILVHMHVTAWT